MRKNYLEFISEFLPRVFVIILCLITTTASFTYAQNVKVSGKITAEAGEELIGVSVVIKGTTQGTTTDVNGYYSLNAPTNGTLVFTYLGFLQEEVPINFQTQINLSMFPDIKELNQVVVVGYGTMRRSDLTGAISSISQKDISNVRSANAVEAMQGKVAGVDMTRSSGRAGSGYSVQVRGTRSLTASNDPLYIVDGIQYPGTIDINPNDIESIEVLKDASSTAIYGARGANGVVMITTKKGKKGEPRVSFNTYQGMTMANGSIPVADRDYYLRYRSDLTWMKAIGSNFSTNIPKRDPSVYLPELTPRETDGLNNGIDYDWYKKVLRKGTQQDYNLTFTGGSDKLVYSASLNHFKENGLIDQDQFKRYNVRLNLEAPVKKYLTIGTSSLITFQQQTQRANPLGAARQMSPLVTPFVDQDGNMIDADEADGVNVKLIPYPNSPFEISSNPLITADPNYHFIENRVGRVFTTFYGSVTFLKYFNFKSSFNTELEFRRDGTFNGAFPGVNGVSTSEVKNRMTTNYQWQNILSFDKQFGDHKIQLTAGHEMLYRRSERYRTSTQDLSLGNSQWYALYSGNQQSVTINLTEEGGKDVLPLMQTSLMSYLGRFFYSYKGKYSLQVTARYDGASQLQDKWSLFPSISAAWNLSEEGFIQNLGIISNLKLRGGYGMSGNFDVDAYSTLGRITPQTLYYQFGKAETDNNGYRTYRSGNPNLGWERTKAINAGVDYGFLSNRIMGSIDVYTTTTEDLLLDQLLSPASGISRSVQNVGATSNKGIELSLRTINIKTEDFTWSTNFTFSKNIEKITALASGQQKDIANGWFVGSPVQVYYDKKKTGIWQLNEVEQSKLYSLAPGDIKFQDLNKDTLYNDADRVIIGTPRPNWTGGLNSTVQFRGWDLNVFVFARMGQMIRDQVASAFQPDGRVNTMQLNYWTPENPTNETPRLDPNKTNSGYQDLKSLEYTDGSFVKIRDITLGYQLPYSWTKGLLISKLRIYATAKNPFIFSKYFNQAGGRWDPELKGSMDIPLAKMYALGLNIEF